MSHPPTYRVQPTHAVPDPWPGDVPGHYRQQPSPVPFARSWPDPRRSPSPSRQTSHPATPSGNGGHHAAHGHHHHHHQGYGASVQQQPMGSTVRPSSRRSSSSSTSSHTRDRERDRDRTLAQARRMSLNQSSQSIASASSGTRPKRVIVAVRVRPSFLSELQRPDFQEVVRVNGRKASVAFDDHRKEFVFDDCFGPEVRQASVYERVGRPIVDNVMRGINGTIFAYGQTGTGKTHTMGLLRRLPTDRAQFDGAPSGNLDREQTSTGIVARALWDIFERVRASQDEAQGVEWEVTLTFLQLYCESLQNLLDPSTSNLAIREDPRNGFYVEGLSERLVSSYREAADFVNAGLENRMIAGTQLNTTSSRSHVILTATVSQFVPVQSATGETYTRTFRGKLALVDLAGSERVSYSRSEGMRLDEAKAINKSLTLLGNVIASLADRRSPHVSYRSSKLTTLLQDSLGGNAITSLVATVSTSKQSRRETVSSFLFAQRCMAVRTRAIINDETDRESDMRAAELEQRLALVEREYAQREAQLVAQHEETVRQLTESLHMLEATPRGVKPEPIPQSMQPPPVSSLPVMAYCYRLLTDLYARTRGPIHDSKARATERANEVQRRLRAAVGADGEPVGAVDADLIAGAQAIVEETYPPMLGSGKNAVQGPVPLEFPTIDDIDGEEQLLSWLRKVHASVAGNIVFCARLLEHSEETTSRTKEDLVRHEVAAARREVELENWGTTLKDLLNTNAALLARITRLQQEQNKAEGTSTPGGQLRMPRQRTSSAEGRSPPHATARDPSPSSNGLPINDAAMNAPPASHGANGLRSSTQDAIDKAAGKAPASADAHSHGEGQKGEAAKPSSANREADRGADGQPPHGGKGTERRPHSPDKSGGASSAPVGEATGAPMPPSGRPPSVRYKRTGRGASQ